MRMKRLPRTGWLIAGVTQPESIADHSYGTIVIATFLAEMVNSASSESEDFTPLDVDRVAKIALIHDMAESLVTDLPRQTTELLGREVKHEVERQSMERIFASVVAGQDYMELWNEYESDSSAEARLVHDADKLDMILQAREYERAGNQNLAEFWESGTWNYSLCEQLVEQMRAEHRVRS